MCIMYRSLNRVVKPAFLSVIILNINDVVSELHKASNVKGTTLAEGINLCLYLKTVKMVHRVADEFD